MYYSIDRMIVIRCQQNCLFIEKSSNNCIDDGIRFPRSGRTLYVGNRIFYGIMYRKQLIQIRLTFQQRDWIILSSDRTACHLSKERFNRICNTALLKHFHNCSIFRIQIHLNIRGQCNQIRAVIYPFQVSVIFCNPVLYDLPVSLKIFQQIKITRFQKLPDTLPFSVYRELSANCNIIRRL